MLQPRKIKRRKQFSPVIKRGHMSRSGFNLDFGSFGIVALENGWLTSRQIEAARRAMTRYVKRGGKIWIRVFPHSPVTAKPPEVGMGGGKGNPDKFVANISAGRVLFEMDGIPEEVAKEALRLAAHKLPFKTKYVSKEEE